VILVIQAEVYCNLLNYLSAYLKSVRWSLDYYLLIVSSSSAYYILIIAPFFFGCGGPVKEENKNNASASSLSLHVGNEKYRSTWIISGLLSSASADPTRICITKSPQPAVIN